MPLTVIQYPHPTLRHVSKPVKKVDATLRGWVAEMLELMYEHEGVGLAANQVDLPYRLFVANPEGDPEKRESEQVFINPVILSGKGSAEAEEGCLSIPQVYGPVMRKESVMVQAYNLKGEEFRGELKGLFARIVQHEIDHLDGTLFIDRLAPTHKLAIGDQLEEFEIVFRSERETGEMPSDEVITKRIAELEAART